MFVSDKSLLCWELWGDAGGHTGFYENQDPGQADMNFRGRFTTNAEGRFAFRSIKPAGYPIPIAGPVGEMLRALGRHNMRPAHVHFVIIKDGYKTQVSQVYVPDDPNLETEKPPAPDVTPPWYSLAYTFVIEEGVSKLPRAPITAKATGERPKLAVLRSV